MPPAESRFIPPSLATLRAAIPSGDEWLHEIKFDGYRVQAQRRGDHVTIFTRRGYDWTALFEELANVLLKLPCDDFVIDGEVVVPDERGISDFHRLQDDVARKRRDRFVLYAFDLLRQDGVDLRSKPLSARKAKLADLLKRPSSTRIRYSDHLEAHDGDVLELACKLHLEGIVSKRRSSRYRSGRTDDWIKTKCLKSDDYPIIAFVEKLGAKPRRIASLYVGRRDGDRLLYAGKIKTGYSESIAREVREHLDPHIRQTSPLSHPVKKPKATWVEPVVRAEVQFSGITADGLLREASFKGLRLDLKDAPARRARTASSRSQSSTPRVPRENILQLLPDADPPTKDELIGYWQRVGKRALKYLANRPLKLVRHTRDTTFYHKGRLPPVPSSVHQLKIAKREGGEGTRLWVDDVEGLLGLVDIGAVELHPWNATVDDIELADTLVFDFDPGVGIEWEFVVESALAMRTLLRADGKKSWPKLTGGKGIHVMVPLDKRVKHDVAHAYCKRLAEALAATNRQRYTTSAALSARRGRLFIDYLRNGRGTTAIGTYSPRARPTHPIAAPTTWAEIERGIQPTAYTVQRPLKRQAIRRSLD